jgi:hypothetical protein
LGDEPSNNNSRVGTLPFAHPTPSLALKGIELSENATRKVSASDTLARERGRAPALQIFVALLRGDGSPEFGECDEDESEAWPMAGLDLPRSSGNFLESIRT